MNSIKYFFILLVTSTISFDVPAQSTATAPSQLVALVNKAMDNYPKLKQAAEMVKLAEAGHQLATGSYMPVISGNASYRYAQPTPVITIPIPGYSTEISFIPANNYDVNLSAVIPIYDFGKTTASVKKTLSDIATAQDNLQGAKNELAYQVAQLYYGIVFLNKSIDVQNEQIKLLEENEKLIQDKIKNGDALKFDLLSTQVKKNNVQNVLIDLQTQLEKQYELLDMLTGESGADYIADKQADDKAFDATDVNADNNIDVKLMQDKINTTNWDLKIAKRGWMPQISGNAFLGTQNGYVPDINKMEFKYGAGVGLSIPIFSSARPNFQTKIAKINMQVNQYALEAQKLSVNKDVLQAKSDIAASERKLKNYDIQIQQAQEALDLANIRYKAGVITSLEQLTAQTNLQDAELGQIQLQYNLLVSKLQLNKLGEVKFW